MLPFSNTAAILTTAAFQALERRRGPLLRPVLGLCLAGLPAANLLAQTSVALPTDAQTHVVRGQVVNSIDGSPLPRVLVTINTRSALTDYQGRFEFAAFTGTNAFATVRKPGFHVSADGSANPAQRLTNLDTPILLKLYPDAMISGTLTSRDGTPLSHVPVRLLRSQYDGVAVRLTQAGVAQTNARGEYQIGTAAGRFRIVTSFIARSFETGEAVLPVSFPENNQRNTSTLFEVRSGEEKRVDLRARVGSVYPVVLRVEPSNPQHGNFLVGVTTSAGDEFLTGFSADHLELPTGTYALRVKVNNRDESMSGTSRVTVTDHDPASATVHLAPDTRIAVELLAGSLASVSPGANSSNNSSLPQLPNAQMFNLSLQNELVSDETQDQDIRLHPEADKGSSFQVPPGRYRLTASGGGLWHVESASVGATDLLMDDLVIGPGSAGGILRLVVSNQTGTVHARTSLGVGASAWMYLVPRGPSLLPVRPISVTSDSSAAAIATASVPPGAYTALLSDIQLQTDPRDPAFLASFASGPMDIDVRPNADTSFSLELAKRKAADQ